MKLFIVSFLLITGIFLFSWTVHKSSKDLPVLIPLSKQRTGDKMIGYNYLITGDYLKSGIPLTFYRLGYKKDTMDLQRAAPNKNVTYSFTVVTAPNGEKVVAPNCLQCHAQVFDGKLIVGLGNTLTDFTDNRASVVKFAEKALQSNKVNIAKYEAAKNFIDAVKAVSPQLVVPVRGVNIADRLASLLAAHRDPVTFTWNDKAKMKVPDQVIPTDVPAWWLLKKKNAMFYSGFGRGDFGRFLMASNLLTVKDTNEAREVDSHFNDVLAYLQSIAPPKYPGKISQELANKGKTLFVQNCSGCHGTYGQDGSYPNLLIPGSVIQTDPLLYSSNYSSPQFLDWFNKSWFTSGDHPAQLIPFRGYIAPPLDGIWITAPFLHNGSVPNLETLLNSKHRPKFWSRNFDAPTYDYENIGYTYKTESASTNISTYNTSLPGYSNTGHLFGDKFTEKERSAVIEYLKTL